MQLIRDILVFVLVFGGHVVGLLKVSRKTVHLLLSPFELVLHPVQITLSPTKVQKLMYRIFLINVQPPLIVSQVKTFFLIYSVPPSNLCCTRYRSP